MLDGKGNVVKSNIISIYYKRRPASDPYCSLTSGEPHAQGNCVPLPNGLRFIFGYDMLTANAPTGSRYFTCKGQTATASESYQTMAAAEEHCPTAQNPDGTYNQLGLFLQAPDCWDGKNLDSANHRDHVAYISYGYWGFPKCPATHPYVIPAFTMGVWYTVDANLPTWHLSSDEMLPGTAPGTTLHADWFGAWDNTVEAMWMDKCINNHLNCSGGDLGSGRGVNGMWGINWVTNPRLVPVP